MQERFIVSLNQPVQELLKVMSRLTKARRPSGFAVVVDDKNHIVGVVTDGDIRKFMITTLRMPIGIDEVVNRNFIFVNNRLQAADLLDEAEKVVSKLKSEARFPIKFLPVLDENRVVGLLDLEDMSIAGDNGGDQIVIVGLGYVGLTLAGFFLGMGQNVIGVDSDESKLKILKSGKSYITEPGLDHIISQKAGKQLLVTDKLEERIALKSGGARSVFIVCVPTPVSSDGVGDLGYVENAISEIAKVLRAGDLVVLRSTLPLGTSDSLAGMLEKLTHFRAGIDFSFVFAPERTVEGNALKEIGDLPQIVAGFTSHCLEKGLDFFEKFGVLTVPAASLKMAELIKIASNAYRDYTFAFANYLAVIAQEHSIDVNATIKAANFGYPRNSIPTPSPGVGGPCLTKDPYLLISSKKDLESPVKKARELNLSMPKHLVTHMQDNISDLFSKVVCVVGVAFKGLPETNDIRNSPGIDLLDLLVKMNSAVTAWDSVADIESLGLNEVRQLPNVFVLANNHPRNREYFAQAVRKYQIEPIYLVDPWRLISSNELEELRSHKIIHYLSLSHYEEDLR